jgi:hypothetical protein
VTRDELDARLRALAPDPDRARIELVIRRLPDEGREAPDKAVLDPAEGLVGDRWATGSRKLHSQVTLMRWDVAALLSPTPGVFGDNLFASLDTSLANLPPGTTLKVGTAVCEVTSKPHTGCAKFARRAGQDALDLSLDPAWLPQQLRGVHLRVIGRGTVRVGDALVVLERP